MTTTNTRSAPTLYHRIAKIRIRHLSSSTSSCFLLPTDASRGDHNKKKWPMQNCSGWDLVHNLPLVHRGRPCWLLHPAGVPQQKAGGGLFWKLLWLVFYHRKYMAWFQVMEAANTTPLLPLPPPQVTHLGTSMPLAMFTCVKILAFGCGSIW